MWRFCTYVENTLDEVEEKYKEIEHKRMARMAAAKELLEIPDEAENGPPKGGVTFGLEEAAAPPSKPPAGGFADPAEVFGGSAKVGSQSA